MSGTTPANAGAARGRSAEPHESIGARLFSGLVIGLALAVGGLGRLLDAARSAGAAVAALLLAASAIRRRR